MDGSNFSFCAVCAKHFSGIESYIQHMDSEKHKRKVDSSRRLEMTSPTSSINFNGHMEVKEGMPSFTSQSLTAFFCETCKVSMTGPESYAAHLNGGPHSKKVKKLELLKTFDPRHVVTEQKCGSSFDKLEATTSSDSDSGTFNLNLQFDVVRQNMERLSIPNQFYCDVCGTSMTGLESYQAHIRGSPHAKKVRNLNLQKEFGTETVDAIGKKTSDLYSTGAAGSNFFCEICHVTVCGATNFDQHLKGASHHKKKQQMVYCQLQSTHISESVKSEAPVHLGLSNSPTCNLFCDICNVSVSGEVNFRQHLNGASHKKMEKQKEAIRGISPVKSIVQLPLFSNEMDVSTGCEENEGEKTLEELKEKVRDVLFCYPNESPMQIILNAKI